jgi:hypothetical protein
MSRRGRPVPEAAPVVGVVLAFSAVLYGYLFAPEGTLLPVFLVALLTLYAFTAFAVVRTDAPASVLRPDAVLAAGFLLAVLAGAYGLAVAGQPMFAAFVALVAAVPPALYHARYGDPVNPLDPRATLVAALGGTAVLLALGVLVGDPAMATVDAVVLALAAADYRETRGPPMDPTAEATLVAACLGGGGLAVVYFVLVVGRAATGVLVGAGMLVVGAYFSL